MFYCCWSTIVLWSIEHYGEQDDQTERPSEIPNVHLTWYSGNVSPGQRKRRHKWKEFGEQRLQKILQKTLCTGYWRRSEENCVCLICLSWRRFETFNWNGEGYFNYMFFANLFFRLWLTQGTHRCTAGIHCGNKEVQQRASAEAK